MPVHVRPAGLDSAWILQGSRATLELRLAF
jgi:hypothetical protein